MYSLVIHNDGFYLIFFLYKMENVPNENGNRRPVPVKVIYLHDTSLFILSASLYFSLHFVLIDTSQMATLLGKELVTLLFECVVGRKCFCFFFPSGVYVGILNLIASISGPSILTLIDIESALGVVNEK